MTRLFAVVVVLLFSPSAHAQTVDWSVEGDEGAHIRILRDYELPAGATVREPVVVLAGSATIDGHAGADVVVIGGSLKVGPKAVIDGDVVAIGGSLSVDPGARIDGARNNPVVIGPDIHLPTIGLGAIWWPAVALAGTILRLGTILIVALLLAAVAPEWVGSMARRAAAAPITSAGIGAVGQLLFAPAVIALTVALVVSVVGILLLVTYPFLFGAGLLIWAAGFTAVAANLGAAIRRQPSEARVRVGDVVLGLAVICGLTLAAQLLAVAAGGSGVVLGMMRVGGWLVEWLAWTVGLGAALAVLLGPRQSVPPPPLPYAPAV